MPKPRRTVTKIRTTARALDCPFCKEDKLPDYKDWEELRSFLTDRGKIVPRARSGVCAKHQRRLAKAIKYARHLSLLPFTVGPSD